MKIYTKQEWDAIINPIIQNKNTSNFETACSYFRQICQEIGQEISNPGFKGGYDEMVNFYNHSSYKTDRGLQLAIAWAGCNDLCKYEAEKIGLTSPQWWYRCWYGNIYIDFGYNYTWQPTDYILVVTGCGNSDYNGEYKLLDTSATGTTKEWHHTTNNYRIVWSDDHWIFTSKSDYMTYYYSNKVTYPWDATWYSTHEGDLTEIKVIKKSDLIKVVFTLSGSSNNQVNGEFIQTAETAWQTGQNASYTNGKVYVWYNSSFNCWFCTYVLGDATSEPPLHASNGTGDDPWSVADGWNGVTCSRDIIFSVTGFSKYVEGANGDYLQTADTVGKTETYAVYTNGPYYFFYYRLHKNWYVGTKVGDTDNAVSRQLFGFNNLNPWGEATYLTIQPVAWSFDDLTFTMDENGGSGDEPDDIPIPANGFKVTGVTSPASLNGVYSLTSGDISDLSSCQWTNANGGHLKHFSGGYWIFGDSTSPANTPDDCFYWSHGGIDGKKPWEITSWNDGQYNHSGTLVLSSSSERPQQPQLHVGFTVTQTGGDVDFSGNYIETQI